MPKCARRGCYENGTRRADAPGPGWQTVDVCPTHLKELEDLMKAKCAVTTCDTQSAGKGLCQKHYMRFHTRHWLEDFPDRLTPTQADGLDARYQKLADADLSLKKKIRAAGERAQQTTAETDQHVQAAKPGTTPVPPPAPYIHDGLDATTRARRTALASVPKPNRVDPVAADPFAVLINPAELAELRRKAKAVDLLQARVADLEEVVKVTQEREASACAEIRTRDASGVDVRQVPDRFIDLLRESRPLRLALVEAMHERALRTLRLAAENPASADTLLADLFSSSPG